MAQEKMIYTGQSTTGPSRGLWSDCPRTELLTDPECGWYHFNDFINGPRVDGDGWYECHTGAGGGGISANTEQGGVITLDPGAADDATGIGMSVPFIKISQDLGKAWFEARVKFNSIASTAGGSFIGLLDNSALGDASPITTAGILANVNALGFVRLEADQDALDTVYSNDSADVTVGADAVTVAAGTWYKLGIYFDGVSTVKFFLDDVELADKVTNVPDDTGTTFPADEALRPVIVAADGAATAGDIQVDWWAAAQLR